MTAGAQSEEKTQLSVNTGEYHPPISLRCPKITKKSTIRNQVQAVTDTVGL